MVVVVVVVVVVVGMVVVSYWYSVVVSTVVVASVDLVFKKLLMKLDKLLKNPPLGLKVVTSS